MFWGLLFLASVPASCGPQLQAIQAALQVQDLRAASALLKRTPDACKTSAAYLQLSGIEAQLSGDTRAAELAFKQAFKIDPKHISPPVLFTLAGFFAKENNDAQVVACLNLIPESQADEAVSFNLGSAYSRLKQFDRARAAYFEAIDKKPDYVEAYLNVGLDYASGGDLRRGIPWLNRAHLLAPHRADITYALSESLLQLGYKKTVADLLPLDSGDPLLKCARADLMMAQGNIPEAKRLYEAAGGQLALAGLARVAIAEGQTQLARDYLRSAQRNAATNEVLGLLEAREEHWQAAIPLLRAETNHLEAALALARAYAATGQIDQAVQLLRRTTALFPDSAVSHLELSHLLRRAGRTEDANREQSTFSALQAQKQTGLNFANTETYVF